MLERELYSRLVDGADAEDWLMYRIADGSSGKKPFDIGGRDHQGNAIALEVKVSSEAVEKVSDRPLPWRQFEMHQRAWLGEFARPHSLSLIGIYYEESKTFSVYRLLRNEPDDLPRSTYHVGNLTCSKGEYRGWKKLKGR